MSLTVNISLPKPSVIVATKGCLRQSNCKCKMRKKSKHHIQQCIHKHNIAIKSLVLGYIQQNMINLKNDIPVS